MTTDRKSTREKPLVYVDVNVGLGRTGRIGLYAHDNPRDLAHNFAKAFSLNLEMEESLAELLNN